MRLNLHYLKGEPASVLTALETAKQVEGVDEVHDLHIWTITSGHVALSAHVVPIKEVGQEATARALECFCTRLKEDFGIGHTTIEMERSSRIDRE